MKSSAHTHKRALNRRSPQPLALEARLMFDGAAAADFAAASTMPVGEAATDTPANTDPVDHATPTQRSDLVDTSHTEAPIAMRVLIVGDASANGGRREVAFVDSAVQNWQSIVEGMRAGIEVVLIDSRADGLTQIADYLEQYRNLDAVHIISHGQEGELVLGSLHMNASNLSECLTDLARVGAALTTNGDLLLYGCDVAQGAAGLSFIGQLSQASGADVAASNDATGSAKHDANWVLEANTGLIESSILLTQAGQAAYDGELALPGVHTGSNSSGIFLGGNYIELGIRTNNSIGKFGADTNPGGAFTGRTNASNAAIAGIGMVGDADGFGTGAVLNIDYFMPGTPEEGFYAGYKIGGAPTTGKNFGSTVTNTSSGNTLSATVTGSIGGKLTVTQAISFDVNDLFFRNVVTLTNISAGSLDNVRFMRAFDPDNTVDKSGSYSTVNTIERTFAAGDSVAVVSAKSSTGDTYYTRSGSKQATIVYYSSDNRAKVGRATTGLAPSGVYDANIYDSAVAKGMTGTHDAYISIAADVGTLAAGASTSFTYFTSLDNRDIATILSSISAADAKVLPTINEDPGSNTGGTVTSVFGSAVAITAADNTHGQWQYSNNGGSSWTNFGSVVASSARMLDTTYSVRFVPDADWNGGSSLTYRVWNGSGFTAGSTGDASSAGSYFSASTASASITVNAVNDAPFFTKGSDQSVNEDAGAQTVSGWATSIGKGGGSDETSQTLSFTVSNNNNALFAAQPTIDAAGNLTYTPAANASGSATVTVSIADSGGTSNGGVATSASQTFTITINAVNDAPVASGSVAMTGITEDATTSSGQLVSSFLSSTDADTAPLSGIAITSLSSGNGTWQYSLNSGASWIAVGSVSNANALLLNSADRVRFVPNASNADTPTITYRAWDRTNDNTTTITSGQKTDVSSNGSSSAYSSGTQTATLAVSALNDAPVLTPAAPTLTAFTEDDTSNAGQLISSILGSSLTDVDSGALQGVAISALSSGNGVWEYSTNAGTSWTSVGSVAINNALLLRASDKIRFVPNGANGGSASFSYKAWDQTTGSTGSKVDATVGGSTTAFSTASDTASITVSAVNDAPVLGSSALTFASINEDTGAGSGQTVAALLGSTLSDVDSAAVQGIAITGSTVINNGYWEYSTDAGNSWSALGSVSAVSARLLNSTDRLRYVSDGYQGGTATLTLRAWDQTSGTPGGTADTSSNGGTTAFSSIAATASITVTDINDAPQITTAASDASFTENGSAVAAGNSIVIRDDYGPLQSASISISSGFTSGDTLAVTVGATGITASYNSSTGVMTLSGTASTANYQTVLRSLTFIHSSDDPTQISTTRTLSWSLTDTNNLTGTAGSSTITLTPTADAPTLSNVPSNWSYTEDDGARIIAPTLTLTDSDDSQLSGATVSINLLDVNFLGYLDDGYEFLAATTTGTNITANFDSASAVLSLSGTDTAANYQKVLRSVTYLNTRDYNNPSGVLPNSFSLNSTFDNRQFLWQVTDANSDGANGSPTFIAQNSSVASTTVTILDANETPQVSNVQGNAAHISYTEGGSAATLEGILTVSDDGLVSTINSAYVRVTAGLEAGDQLGFFSGVSGWTQTGTATSGTLDDGSGKIVAYNWSASTGDFSLSTTAGATEQTDYTNIMQKVGFVSTSDDPTASNATRSLIWRVTDSGGLQSAVTSAQTTIIDITALNDNASVSGLPASGDVVFIENGNDVQVASGLILSDADDTQVASASVTLSGAGFSAGYEYLSLPGSSASSSINWSVSNFNGTGIDAFYTWSSGTLSLTASSGSVSIATLQSVLRQVGYGNVNDNPTAVASTRTLSWSVTDVFGSRITDTPAGNNGDSGGASTPVTSTITISPRNDKPTLSSFTSTSSYTEGSSASLLAPTGSVSDSDDSLLSSASVWISAGFTAGDTLVVTSAAGLSTSYDNSTGILSLSGLDSIATYRAALRSVRFSSSSDDPSRIASTRTISWTVTDNNAAGDGAQTSSVSSGTVRITASDDGASLSSLSSVTYTENGSVVAVAPSGVLSDADDSMLAGLTVTISAGKTTGDLLSVTADLTGTGITVTAYNSSTGELVLSGNATLADYRLAMNSIVFSSTSEEPTATSASRTLTWSTVSAFGSRLTDYAGANDGGAGVTTASAGSNTITITPLNDAPTISLDDGTVSTTDAPGFQQGGAAIFAIRVNNTAGGVTLSDGETAEEIASASVVISDSGLATDILTVATPAGWVLTGNTFTKGGASVVMSFTAGSSGALSLSGNASRADYTELLNNVKFSNSSVAPTANGAARTLTWTISDTNTAGDGARSATTSSRILIADLNDSPMISPSTATVSYNEGDSSVTVPTLTVSDPDTGEIVTATLTLSDHSAGVLTASGSATYTAGTGVWTITDTVANVNAALAAINFLPTSNNDADLTITANIVDGGEDGAIAATAIVTLDVTGANDAPIMVAAAPTLSAITEDATNNAGQTVASFRGSTSDVDTGSLFGIAIHAQNAGTGSWEYSLDAGSSWTAVGSVSAASALVLRDTDRIRFVPNAENGTAGSLTYYAWDQTGGAAGSKLDASSTGGGSAYSIVSDTASISVSSLNDAPTLSTSAPSLSTLTEDDTSNTGDLISALLAGSVADVDSGAVQGLAITALSSGNGTWQYSLDGGSTWSNVGSVSSSNALLLRASDTIRFLPDGQNATSASFTYHAWDRSSGSAGSKVDASTTGNTTAFSSVSDTASISVTAVNDAPVMVAATPTLNSLTEDQTNNAGQTVASFLASSITDVDSSATQGIALTGSTNGNGTWQYSLDGGSTWSNVGSLSASSSRLLRSTDYIRFVPNAENATSATLSYRAWDSSVGTAGSTADTTSNGGNSAFSLVENTASISVTTVNDAPTLTASAPSMATLTENDTSNAGELIAAILGSAVSDTDSGAVQGLAITALSAANGTWQYSLDGGSTWNNVGSVSASNALLLRASDTIRFLPDGQNATSASFTYHAWDRSSGSAGSKVDASSTGNTTAFSSVSDTASISVTAVNDAPVMSAATPTLNSLTEDQTNNAGQTVASFLASSSTDVDGGAVQGLAITALSSGNGTWQYSLDGGSTWSNVGSVSSSNALLLRSSDTIRFLPDGQNATSASFTYHAWDRSSGSAGSKVDASSTGNTTAFSSVSDTASISVTAVNDAPVMVAATPTLNSLTEDQTNNAGQTVASFLASSITDIDGGATQGIALTGSTDGNGTWQYSLDGGSTWSNVGSLSASSSRLLRSTDYIRFVPNAQNATSATLSYRAWDSSVGTAGSTADTTTNGGNSAFSLVENTASISVTAVNDAPINNVAPTISGGARVDATLRQDGVLTANPQTWSELDLGDPATLYTYQWQVADDASGSNLRNITGATNLNYTLTAAEIGKFVRVRVTGSDGTSTTQAFSSYSVVSNSDPVAAASLATQQASESVAFSFSVPDTAFIDGNSEDTLYYSATLADGSPLPAWLSFDANTRTFSGTPGGGDVGVLTVRVFASDRGAQTAQSDFTLRVLGVPSNAKSVNGAAPAETPPQNPNTELTQVKPSDGASFIQLEGNQGLSIYAIEPPHQDAGKSASAQIQAIGAGIDAGRTTAFGDNTPKAAELTRPDGFRIAVNNTLSDDVALLLVRPMADQFVRLGGKIQLNMPEDTFMHTRQDAVITLTASRLDGRAIPSWLRFNAMRGEFGGEAPRGFEGDIEVKVTARDNFGNEATTIFRFRVHANLPKVGFVGREGLSAQLRTQAARPSLR